MRKLGKALFSSVQGEALPLVQGFIGFLCMKAFLSKVFESQPWGDFEQIVPLAPTVAFLSLAKSYNSWRDCCLETAYRDSAVDGDTTLCPSSLRRISDVSLRFMLRQLTRPPSGRGWCVKHSELNHNGLMSNFSLYLWAEWKGTRPSQCLHAFISLNSYNDPRGRHCYPWGKAK